MRITTVSKILHEEVLRIRDMNTGDVNKGVNKNRGRHPGNRTPAQEKDVPGMAVKGSPMMTAVQKPRQLYKGEWKSLAR